MKNQIHPATNIGYVHLKVSELERSILFYREVIGLDILRQEEGMVELSPDGIQRLLVLEELPNALPLMKRKTTGLYHMAILVPTRRDLGLSLRNLIKHQVRIGQGDHNVSEALYLSDPDANGIEIYADRPRDAWKFDQQGHLMMGSDPVDWQSLLAEAGDDPWNGLAAGTRIGHVHLHVSHLNEAESFYCGLLGFDLMMRMEDSALFISAGGYHHHIGLNTWAGVGAPPAPHNSAGLQFYTIRIHSQTELDSIVARLRDAGVSVEQRSGGWYVQDPSDNGILLV